MGTRAIRSPRTLSLQDTPELVVNPPRRTSSSSKLSEKLWASLHTKDVLLNCSVSQRIRDAFDSWRSDWALTSVPRESEKKCLESSNNKERLPLLESTKCLLLLFNREKIFTSPKKKKKKKPKSARIEEVVCAAKYCNHRATKGVGSPAS